MKSFKVAVSLEQPIEQYLTYLQKDKQLAVNSVINYQCDLYAFRDFIADYRVQHWHSITAKQVQAFINNAQIQEKSSATTARLTSSIQGFITYLRKNQILTFDPLLGFKVPQNDRKTKPFASPIDCKALLNINPQDFLSARDKAMLEVLVNTGIRVSELVALELFSIDFSEKVLRVPLKGNIRGENLRVLPLTESVERALKIWFSYRQQVPIFDQALFVSKKGKRLSVRGIQLRITFCSESSIGGRVTANRIRQSFAQQLDTSAVTVDKMMKMMGRSNLYTTVNGQSVSNKAATRKSQKELLDCYQSAHPRAKKLPKGEAKND